MSLVLDQVFQEAKLREIRLSNLYKWTWKYSNKQTKENGGIKKNQDDKMHMGIHFTSFFVLCILEYFYNKQSFIKNLKPPCYTIHKNKMEMDEKLKC